MDDQDAPLTPPVRPLLLPTPLLAKFKLTRPDPERADYWLLRVEVGEKPPDETEYHMTTAGLRSFLGQVAGAIPDENDKVQLMVGGLRLTISREQWPRLQDYFSLFEGACR